MAEALVSGLIDQLVEKEDVQISGILREIQPFLEDAERRQVKDPLVRNWLFELKDVSCDMEDVLDEWKTTILKLKIRKQEFGISKKVRFSILSSCFCFSQVCRVGQRDRFALRVKDIRERLSGIAADRGKFSFNYLSRREIEQRDRRRWTTSLVEESAVYGRVEDQNILVSKLLCESSEEGERLIVVPIVGMGGLGKTTLAQLAYNDERVRAHFDLRFWVCVSDSFHVMRIAKSILQYIDLDRSQNLVELGRGLEQMHEFCAGKKLLLVLDDVWNEDLSKWERLKQLFCTLDCKILVTTRKENIACMMGTTTMIKLGALSNDDCWSIFRLHAFPRGDMSAYKPLEEIGRKIIKKCEGLPLAAKALGGLLRSKYTRLEWEEVLHELEPANQEIFPVLLLSYYDMSPPLRRCFSYCAIFPKDHVIERDNLIKLWMSQGYLDFNKEKEKEILGEECFMHLAMRSLLQDFEKDYKGSIVRCKMHDLVHDVAQFLSEYECFITEVGATNEMESVIEKARHHTLVLASGPATFPISTCKGNSLRTLFFLCPPDTTVNPNIYLPLKCLRTLNFGGCWFTELPKEVGEFIHLRYLNLSGNDKLERLPETLCDLFNLQTLLINDCMRLRRLPEAMEKLVNLRHLHIDWSFNLEKLPKGIAKLTSLQTLDMLVVPHCDEDEAFQLRDLKRLNNLKGYLRICRCGNLENLRAAEEAELMDRDQFVDLNLDFDWTVERRLEDKIILEALQPHPNLESLEIRKYRGTTISPDWMMGLTNLRRLVLYSCQYCESLPPLGKLSSLESLEICLMKSVKTVGLEFLGIENDDAEKSFISFPKLSELRFSSLSKWKVWEGSACSTEADVSVKIMPCLKSLEIDSCFFIQVLPDFLKMTPLQNLTITGCRILQQHCRMGRGKEWIKISHIPNIKINC